MWGSLIRRPSLSMKMVYTAGGLSRQLVTASVWFIFALAQRQARTNRLVVRQAERKEKMHFVSLCSPAGPASYIHSSEVVSERYQCREAPWPGFSKGAYWPTLEQLTRLILRTCCKHQIVTTGLYGYCGCMVSRDALRLPNGALCIARMQSRRGNHAHPPPRTE